MAKSNKIIIMKKTVSVVLINKDQYVLGVSRKTNHNDIGLIGGKVDPDDLTTIDAAIRETKEETGLDIFNLCLIYMHFKGGAMSYTYLADYDGDIYTTESHIVKWCGFGELCSGSFGVWNTNVLGTLLRMKIKVKNY